MKTIISAAFALALLACPARAETPVSEGEFANLQAVMQAHIEKNLVDGALLQLDEKSGTVRQLYPATAHPMIMAVGNYFYLCTDFRDAEGHDVMVNFYAARDGDKYIIFHTIFGDNKELEAMVEKQAKLASN